MLIEVPYARYREGTQPTALCGRLFGLSLAAPVGRCTWLVGAAGVQFGLGNREDGLGEA